jgi:putative transposase
VERNAVRAGLVERAEDGMWVSLWLRRAKVAPDPPILSPWPIDCPRDRTSRVNRTVGPNEEKAARRSIQRGQPFGAATWQAEVAARLVLESLFRPRGRSRTQTKDGDGS